MGGFFIVVLCSFVPVITTQLQGYLHFSSAASPAGLYDSLIPGIGQNMRKNNLSKNNNAKKVVRKELKCLQVMVLSGLRKMNLEATLYDLKGYVS
jgi:hypothetical protein